MVPSVYLASPYGFAESTRGFYYERLIPLIEERGFSVIDPWSLSRADGIVLTRLATEYSRKSFSKMRRIHARIALRNVEAIVRADVVVACLDGPDVDSGTASEVGYAVALGKIALGYRGDFRVTGDNWACKANLQVEEFIRMSGGSVTSSLAQLKRLLARTRARLG